MKNFITEVFKSPPTLICKNIILRKMEKFDCEDMFEYASNPETTKYLTWDIHPDISYTRKYLHFIQGQYKSCNFYDWAVCEKASKKMIGTCGFTRIDAKNMTGEIGYVINPKYQNRGYATEAVEKAIEFAFETLALNRIEAKYLLSNEASRRVMDKANMTFEGIHREAINISGEFLSYGICSILRHEYHNKTED